VIDIAATAAGEHTELRGLALHKMLSAGRYCHAVSTQNCYGDWRLCATAVERVYAALTSASLVRMQNIAKLRSGVLAPWQIEAEPSISRI
jgi:hypothetical protein